MRSVPCSSTAALARSPILWHCLLTTPRCSTFCRRRNCNTLGPNTSLCQPASEKACWDEMLKYLPVRLCRSHRSFWMSILSHCHNMRSCSCPMSTRATQIVPKALAAALLQSSDTCCKKIVFLRSSVIWQHSNMSGCGQLMNVFARGTLT